MAASVPLAVVLLLAVAASLPASNGQQTAGFSPQFAVLLACGAAGDVDVTTDSPQRTFVPDDGMLSGSSSRHAARLTNPDTSPPSPLYAAARGGASAFSYRLGYSTAAAPDGNTTLVLRLHFFPFAASQSGDLAAAARFSVSAMGRYVLLRSFSPPRGGAGVVREFFLPSDGSGRFDVTFTPEEGGIAFVNAVELFPAPPELLWKSAVTAVNAGVSPSYQALETLYRLNVGGLTLTPVNDTMWRTWLPDDAYLVPNTISSVASIQGRPAFDGVTYTRMIAPDAVYKSQRTTNSSRSNVTWTFAVDGEGSYVVRLHFCAFEDLSSVVGQGVEFNVYLMKSMATKDLKAKDYATLNMPTQAFYLDYVTTVPAGGENLTVSIGRAASNNDSKEAILNGLEIMKLRTTDMTPAISSGKTPTSKTVIASIAAVLAVAILSGISLCILFVRRRRQRRATQPSPEEEMEEKESVTTPWSPFTPDGEGSVSTGSSAVTLRRMNMKLHIPFAEIMVATGGFSDANLLGVGGFGNVYRGVLRDGTRVAVKRAKRASRQGFPEFQTEIIVLSSIRHRHLVSLIGYCNERSEMILVYELMEHGTLRSHLYGSGDGDGDEASPPPPLSWKQRLEICIGAAKGLHYLHSGHSDNIIHRDVKSTNILLGDGDGDGGSGIVAKVADFGLSRIGPAVGETHVSTAVKGSFGYLDPEYFKTRQLTDRSDVYSFGVVLLEALCARPVIDQNLPPEEINLAEWAMQLSKKGKFERIVDPAILAAGDANMNSLRKFAETAGRCIADYGEHRPSMGDVVWNLEYCLQLQESQTDSGETALDDSAAHLPRDIVVARRVVAAPPPLARNASVDAAGEDMSWSETASFTESGNVFSQIMSCDGR